MNALEMTASLTNDAVATGSLVTGTSASASTCRGDWRYASMPRISARCQTQKSFLSPAEGSRREAMHAARELMTPVCATRMQLYTVQKATQHLVDHLLSIVKRDLA